MSASHILADIHYHPYAVLIAHIDSEQYFRTRTGLSAFRSASDVFARECSRYYRGLKGYLGSFVPYAGQDLDPDSDALRFPSFLFNPACFVAFGDADNIGFVAMDDFDLATHLISQVSLPIRLTCLAFSPNLETLGIKKDHGVFCDVKDICNTPLDHSCKLSAVKAANHEFLRHRPLVAITYYKFNGMAVLGPGLLMQQAAFRAMARQVETAIADIKKAARAAQPADTRIYEAAESFRCAFLDPQGWSDLVSIMLCRDYSVIETVLARLRCLTHEDLYRAQGQQGGEDLAEYVGCFGLHPRMARAFKTTAKKVWDETCAPDALLRDNHTLCATFTTLGISHEAFEQKKVRAGDNFYAGEVIADTKFVCSAGHCTRIKEIARTKYKAPLNSKPGHLWYCVGHGDYVYQQLLHEGYNSDNVVSLPELIAQVKSMRDCPPAERAPAAPYLNPHILDVSTDVRVPILPVPLTEPGDRHVEMRLVLDHIRSHFFGGAGRTGFSLDVLQDQLRRLQLPTPLSSALVFLFTDYANCLCNVFLFDHVVDLHDIFAALYSLLARGLSKGIAAKAKAPHGAMPVLDSRDYDDLVELIDLLRNALANRGQVAFQEAERWGRTLDIRGTGFNRLLNAADVPLKCGLGLLWRVIRGDAALGEPRSHAPNPPRGAPQKTEEIRQRMGGASKITCDARSYSHRLDIGYNPDYFLTSVDLNMAHLTRPQNLLIHLHETAHLICHFLRTEFPCPHPDYACRKAEVFCHRYPVGNPKENSDGHLRERFEDIFAEMLVHRLVFGEDYRTYLRNYAANFSLFEMAPPEARKERGFFRMFDVLMRGFLLTDPFRRPELYRRPGPGQVTPQDLAVGFTQFQEMLDDIRSFLLDFENIWNTEPQEKVRHYFAEVFTESYPVVRCVLQDVQAIYEGICLGRNKTGAPGLDPPLEDQDDLIGQMAKALTTGQPIVRVLYRDPRHRQDAEEHGRLDSLFVVRHLLGQHIRNLFARINTTEYTCCLLRNADGDPDPRAAPGGKKWNRQLLDRIFNGLVAADPGTRGQYMRERIVIIKSLWDISTNLRARRMLDILCAVWPEGR